MNLSKINVKDFGFRALVAFIMICPTYFNGLQYWGQKTMRIGHEQAFQLGITILFIIVFVENIWLSLFALWAIAIYSYYNFPSIGGEYVMNIFMGLILYQVTYRLVTRQRVITIFKAVVALVALNILFTALQYFGYDPLFKNLKQGVMNVDLVGIMGIKAVSGVFNTVCLPIVMYFSWWFAIPVLACIYFSEASCAILGVVAVLMFLIHKKSKKLFLILIIPILVAGGLYLQKDAKQNMITNRVNLWKASLKDALPHPFVGMGLDSFRNIGAIKPFMYFSDTRDNSCVKMTYDLRNNTWIAPKGFDQTPRTDGVPLVDPWDNPHNEYVGLIYEFGVIGFLIIMALLMDIVKRFKYCSNDKVVVSMFASFIAYAVVSVGQFPFHLARTVFLAIVLLACYYKLTDNEIEGVI